jgi:hypothetical protein
VRPAFLWPVVLRLQEGAPHTVVEFGCGSGLLGVAIRDAVEPFWGAAASNRFGWQIELFGVDPAVSVTLPPAAWAYDHLYAAEPLDFLESQTSELAWLNGKLWDVVLALDVWAKIPRDRKAEFVALIAKRAKRFALVGWPDGDWPGGVPVRQMLRLDGHLLVELAGTEPFLKEPASAETFAVATVREPDV